MSRIIRVLVAATAAGGLTLLGLMAVGAASASTSGLGYEVDDGVSWTLATGPSNLSAPAQSTSYADAGIVVDLGPASTFAGLTVVGSGNLAENIWLGDNAEAYTPGTHLLSDPVNFSYGPYDQTFWTGPQAGNPATVAYIDTLGNTEVYAWVGVVYSGSSIKGYVTSVNGQNTSHRNVGVTLSGGTVTAYVK